MGTSRGSGPSAARSALADAAAGVAGSLVSMLAFYPVDVYKTNLQAGKCGGSKGGGSLSRRNRNSSSKKKDDANTILYLLQFLRSSFRGIQYKTAHTIAGSFAYFFFYSWITARHRAYVTGGSGASKGGKYSPSTSARLLLAAIAAMMNTTLTLPLDVISARQQTGHTESDDDEKEKDNGLCDDESVNAENTPQSAADIMNQAWDEADNGDDSPSPPKEIEALVRIQSGGTTASGYVTAEEEGDEEKKGDDDESQLVEETKVSERRRKCSPAPIRHVGTLSPGQIYDLKTIASLWSGLVPSLLLCTNPSIHFTVFDTLKSSILQRKSAAASLSAEGAKGDEPRLSMGEAFFIGLLAKFAATIATYPLIRAKVMLMCNGKGTPIQKEESTDEDRYNFRRGDTTLNFGGRVYDKNAGSGTGTPRSEGTEASQNLWRVLYSIYKNEGVPGLYRGCNLQLIHTLLKSALLMMVREGITVTTRRMIIKPQQ